MGSKNNSGQYRVGLAEGAVVSLDFRYLDIADDAGQRVVRYRRRVEAAIPEGE